MKISIIGAGYVGLVQAAILADHGHEVLCYDHNEARIQQLRKGNCPIHEPGLKELLQLGAKADKLFFASSIAHAVSWGDVIFICVGTPPLPDGSPDLQYIDKVAQEIGSSMTSEKIVVNKSTVPPGTAKRVLRIIKENQQYDIAVDVVSNPEFLREGSAIEDAVHGDRIVIGADSWKVTDKMLELYRDFPIRVLCTDSASAEMIKYASNAFLATKISFINAVAQICESFGADVTEVARGMGMDSRIGDKFLNAGLGWGGSCFGKDASAMIYVAKDAGYDFKLLEATITTNEEMPKWYLQKARTALGGFQDRIVAVLGVAFKPDTDDMRDARSIPIIKQMLEEGAIVRAYDPVAKKNAQEIMIGVEWPDDIDSLVDCADAIMILTEWSEFKTLDWKYIQSKMRFPRVFDGRNMFDRYEMEQLEFEYHSIGR